MIAVNIGKHGDWITVSATGHAGYAEAGQDIVCASVSALMLALHSWLANGGAETKAAFREPGNAYLTFRCSKRSEAVARMILCGVASIQAEYPGFVKLDAEEF